MRGLKANVVRFWVWVIVPLMMRSPYAVADSAIQVYPDQTTNGSGYSELLSDMKVKVMGGLATFYRSWTGSGWVLNPRWQPLTVTPAQITRNGIALTPQVTSQCAPGGACVLQQSSTVFSTNDGFETITLTAGTGYRWQDVYGNWALYDADGCFTAEGNRNNVQIGVTYQPAVGSPAMSGVSGVGGYLCQRASGISRVATVTDNFGTTVITYNYAPGSSQLLGLTDYTGRSVTYLYSSNQLTQVTDVIGAAWTYGYDGNGNLISETDPLGHVQSRTYDANNQLTGMARDTFSWQISQNFLPDSQQWYERQIASNGQTLESWLLLDGTLTRTDMNGVTVQSRAVSNNSQMVVTGSNGAKKTIQYNTLGQPTSVVTADGSQTLYSYEPTFQLLSRETWPDGTVTVYQHDAHGNLTEVIRGYGSASPAVTDFTYDQYGNLTSKLGPAAGGVRYQVQWTYDKWGNAITYATSDGGHLSLTYDVLGNVTSMTDSNQNVWRYTWDAAGNRLSETTPGGRTRQYGFDKIGERTQVTYEAGGGAQFQYDGLGQFTGMIDSTGAVTQYNRDVSGRLVKMTDATGKSQLLGYDAFGRVVSYTDGNGAVSTIGYPALPGANGGDFFRPQTITSPEGATLTLGYDALGRVQSTTLSDTSGNQVSRNFNYDPFGRVTVESDSSGNTIRRTYDPVTGLPTSLSDALGPRATFQLDARGALTSMTDSRGNATTYKYSTGGLLTSETRPLGQTTTYSYDANGRATAVVDPLGQTENVRYDKDGTPLEIDYLDSTGTAAGSVVYQNDSAGRVAAWTDGNVSEQLTHDSEGRLLADTTNYGSFQLGTQYSYFPNGLIQSMTAPDGTVSSYTYDGANQLVRIDVTGLGSISFGSYSYGYPAKTTLPDGTTQTLTLAGILGIGEILVTNPAGGTILDHKLGYDGHQHLVSVKTESESESYGYDARGRLVSASDIAGNESFIYDSEDNLLGPGVPAAPWVYDANNRLIQTPNASYSYDANGNLISKTSGGVTTNYTYDVRNRLVQVATGGSVVASYGYDARDRRIWKQVGTTRTYFSYDEDRLTGEYDSSGNLLVSYGYAPTVSGIPRPLYLKQGGQYYFYHLDSRGAPRKITASGGQVVWSADYSAYGNAAVGVSTITNNLRLPGQYYDAETGLHYNITRYYDPSIGRYLTPDTAGTKGGANLYVYAGANPIEKVDPTGTNLMLIVMVFVLLVMLWMFLMNSRPIPKYCPRASAAGSGSGGAMCPRCGPSAAGTGMPASPGSGSRDPHAFGGCPAGKPCGGGNANGNGPPPPSPEEQKANAQKCLEAAFNDMKAHYPTAGSGNWGNANPFWWRARTTCQSTHDYIKDYLADRGCSGVPDVTFGSIPYKGFTYPFIGETNNFNHITVGIQIGGEIYAFDPWRAGRTDLQNPSDAFPRAPKGFYPWDGGPAAPCP